MQLILIVLALSILAGFIARGSLRPFEHLQVHVWGVALAGLALQIVPLPSSADRTTVTVLLVSSYALLIGFVWLNRRLPAARLMLIGLVLNLTVVGLNGGMPVSAGAVRSAGGSSADVPRAGAPTQKHHLMSDKDVLRPLGDVIPGPRPLGDVLSVGDLFLYGGLAWFMVMVMLGRSGENRRPPSRLFQMYRGKHLPRDPRLWQASPERSARPAALASAARSGNGP